MKRGKVLAGALMAGALAMALSACGGGQAASSAASSGAAVGSAATGSAAAAGTAGDYGYESVTYEDWQLDFGNAKVVWSEEDDSDVIQIPMKATYKGGEESSELANLDNFLAFPGDDTDEYLDWPMDDSLYDIAAENDDTKPGESIEVLYAWVLDGNYGDIRLDIRGYTTSKDDTSVTFGGIEQTAEAKAHEEAAASELAEKKGADEADITGAVIAKPDGWYFDKSEAKSAELKKDGEASGYVDVDYQTNVSTVGLERAVEYAGNYSLDASAVQSATVNGVEWFYFEPAADQFMAFATAGDKEVVRASGMFYSWDDAADVIAAIALK